MNNNSKIVYSELGRNGSCIFIASSDNTLDVFSLISPSILTGFSALGLPILVGLNDKVASAPFQTVPASVGGWRRELHSQISSLPNEYSHLILLLDDFFIHQPMEHAVLGVLLEKAVAEDIDYIRLRPLERSWVASTARYLGALFRTGKLEKISTNEPYYSSLQAAIWKRTHLLHMLEQECSIWDFEHIVLAGSKHYAVRKRFGFHYEHLVEKGRWLRHAPALLPGAPVAQFQLRGFDERRFYRYAPLRKLKFAIYGYTIFRLKRALRLAFP